MQQRLLIKKDVPFLGPTLGYLTAMCSPGWGNSVAFDRDHLPVGREFDGKFLKSVKSPSHVLPPLPKPPLPTAGLTLIGALFKRRSIRGVKFLFNVINGQYYIRTFQKSSYFVRKETHTWRKMTHRTLLQFLVELMVKKKRAFLVVLLMNGMVDVDVDVAICICTFLYLFFFS